MSEHPKLPPAGDYEVGYGKPPKAGRFRKGQSGNPGGRPKGAKNKASRSLTRMRDLVIEEAYREVTVQDKQGPISMPVARAAMRSLNLKSAQGNVAAQKLMMEITSRAEADVLKERFTTFDKVVAYKKEKRAELRAYKARGQEPPMMLPHPDDIEINYETGEVHFHGPVNEDDLGVWNRLHATKEQMEEEIQRAWKELATLDEDDDQARWLREEIEGNEFILMTACLSIARRWHLPPRKVLSASLPFEEFTRHLKNGTDPKPPKMYKKIVE